MESLRYLTTTIKKVLPTEAPNVANPMAHELGSLVSKLDDSGEVFAAQTNFFDHSLTHTLPTLRVGC